MRCILEETGFLQKCNSCPLPNKRNWFETIWKNIKLHLPSVENTARYQRTHFLVFSQVSAYGRRGSTSTTTTSPEGDSSTASSNVETSSKSRKSIIPIN